LKVLICLDDLDKYLDEDKSQPKNLDFKNLDRDKIKVDLDVMDNLDCFQKLVSTAKDVLDLDLDWSRRRDHQPYQIYITLFYAEGRNFKNVGVKSKFVKNEL